MTAVLRGKCRGSGIPGVLQTADGGYIFAGSTASTDGDVTGNHGSYDAWVVKTDSAGTILWQKAPGGSAPDYGFDIQQISDGGHVVASRTESTDGDVIGIHGGIDTWVVNLDSAGTGRWYLTLGGSGDEFPGSIGETADRKYILGSVSFSTDGDVVGNHGGSYDLWVVKHGEGIPFAQPELAVDVKDRDTGALVPDASVGLYDLTHSEWQNVTASDGTATFRDPGASHQYPLAIGTNCSVAASAAGYGQRETMELAKVPGEPEVYTFSMTNTISKFDQPEHFNLSQGELENMESFQLAQTNRFLI